MSDGNIHDLKHLVFPCRLWDYGRLASPALQRLAETGVTGQLEMQMKRFSPSIRSVIKAHGLQQRSNVAGQTFAVFRVDRDHHLLSLVSKVSLLTRSMC